MNPTLYDRGRELSKLFIVLVTPLVNAFHGPIQERLETRETKGARDRGGLIGGLGGGVEMLALTRWYTTS